MKKTLLLTLAVGFVSATPLMATNVYLTGSTAFRSNVHDACYKLFQPGTVTTNYDTTKILGGDGTKANSNPVWAFSGTPIAALTNITDTLTIRANFTGSVQGIQTVEAGTPLVFLDLAGTSTVTNAPTIAFSDVSASSTPYPATGNFTEESVAVQPFVMVKSITTNSTFATALNNVSYEQLRYLVGSGNTPLSAWTYRPADYNTLVYMLNRTKDSGTRRTAFAMEGYNFSVGATIYNWDPTNNAFYKGINSLNTAAGAPGYGVIGAAGLNNANLNWGAGYVGGGDVKKALQYNNGNNLSIAYLSFADDRAITSTNWSQVVSLNGVWPTLAGASIRNGGGGTNDFSPITLGYYPNWAEEVVVYPKVPNNSQQQITATQLGHQTVPGSFLGVLGYQASLSGGTPPLGSLENEIIVSQTSANGATAIRLIDMVSSRAAVGGLISP